MKIDGSFINKEKQKAITAGLEGQYVLVHFDPHAKGVSIPEFLLDRPSVTLKLSYYFKKILHVTPEKVTAELLFGDAYYTCTIPYEAIWGVAREEEGLMMWPGSVPPEVAKILGATAPAAAQRQEPALSLVVEEKPVGASPPKAKKKRATKKKSAASKNIKEVPQEDNVGAQGASPQDSPPEESSKKPRVKPNLVRVK